LSFIIRHFNDNTWHVAVISALMLGCWVAPLTEPGMPSQQSVSIGPEAMRLNADDFVPRRHKTGCIEIGGAMTADTPPQQTAEAT
jgi:hypothetical protein